MLNYLLDKIAGPKCIELKVQNPEKFSFKPKELLSLTSDIFLKLSAHAAFAPAVIRDGRSYNPQVSRISLNPKPGVFNSRCDHKQELLTSLLFALGRTHPPARRCIDSGRRTERSHVFCNFYVSTFFKVPRNPKSAIVF